MHLHTHEDSILSNSCWVPDFSPWSTTKDSPASKEQLSTKHPSSICGPKHLWWMKNGPAASVDQSICDGWRLIFSVVSWMNFGWILFYGRISVNSIHNFYGQNDKIFSFAMVKYQNDIKTIQVIQKNMQNFWCFFWNLTTYIIFLVIGYTNKFSNFKNVKKIDCLNITNVTLQKLDKSFFRNFFCDVIYKSVHLLLFRAHSVDMMALQRV